MINKIKIYGYRIYKNFLLEPNENLNLIVGPNEGGKSTLMEAIVLALTGRANGRYASEDLNPYWFNRAMVREFLDNIQNGFSPSLPEIRIELFFDDRPELQKLCGAINTDLPTKACPGITLKVYPNPDYAPEIEEWKKSPSYLMPVEYYAIDWRSFADEKITRRPRELSTAVIDSRTVRSTSGVDYHLRQMIDDHLQPAERAEISLDFRQMKASMSENSLSSINDRIGELHATLHDRPMALAMDQGARTSWENSVVPHVNNVPFSLSGQGQQAAIKISLAMNRHSQKTNFVMVEEPENHLTHTSLTTLISRIRSLASDEQQLFITTHSSFVLNRLGLDSLLLVENSLLSRIPDLDPETVSYFQKLPGYDTLRMVLAKKLC